MEVQAGLIHTVSRSTCRHRGERASKVMPQAVLGSTPRQRGNVVTRRKSCTCEHPAGSYICSCRQRGRDWEPLGPRPLTGPGGSLGESAEATKGSGVRRSQGDPSDQDWRGQSRASSTPRWRSGVQCGKPVRDPVRPEALGAANRVTWPRDVGMEAGAVASPTGLLSRQPVAGCRKTDGAIHRLRVTASATTRLGLPSRAVARSAP